MVFCLYLGDELVSGLTAGKWRLSTKDGDKVGKYTIWIQTKKGENKEDIAIPLKYEMKGYNTLLGSHYDHYFIEYSNFSPGPPPSDVFTVDEATTCIGFPGPGKQHTYTFNPIKEFVEGAHDHVDAAWDDFIKEHGKEYPSAHQHAFRQNLFRQNLRFIHSTNRRGLGYQLAVNHLADRTDDELAALRGRTHSPGYNGGSQFPYTHQEVATAKVPEQMDWRLYGAVTPVKDQSVCGSCWSFGTTGAVEGAYFVKTGQLISLSQQALIDCSWGYGNNGCDGGEDFRAYQWIQKHGGLPTMEDYGGYLGQDGLCHADQVPRVAAITGYVNVTVGDEQALRLAIFKHGPISVAIDASRKTFSFYSNGVYYDDKCLNTPEGLDHAVLAVGYGTLNGQKYWLVKNSWSNYWGNQGYVLMSSKNNNCGVMTSPTYVTM